MAASLGFSLLRTYGKSPVLYLAFLTIWVVRRVFDLPWNWLDYLCLIGLAVPASSELFAQFFQPARRYRRLLEAVSWGRWSEAMGILPTLEKNLPAPEYAFRRSQALAGLGRLDEAMHVVQPFSDGTLLPTAHYWARLPELFYAAGAQDRILPAMEKAVELAPDDPGIQLDLAMTLLRFDGDRSHAQALLNRVEKQTLNARMIPFLKLVQGLWSLKEGDFQKAVQRFEQALDGATRFQHSGPMAVAAIDRIYAYLALAEAKAGDRVSALQHFRRAAPRLRALRATDLIAECEQVIETPSG